LGGTFAAIDSHEDCEGLTGGELGAGEMEVEADREQGWGELGAGKQMSPMCEISSNLNNSCTESMAMSIESESKEPGARV